LKLKRARFAAIGRDDNSSSSENLKEEEEKRRMMMTGVVGRMTKAKDGSPALNSFPHLVLAILRFLDHDDWRAVKV
jgi:hypothetical protein